MTTRINWFRLLILIAQTVFMLFAQAMRVIKLRLRSRMALAAEHLFLKQQLALYEAPKGFWRRDMNSVRFTLVWLSYWFDWQPALTIVQPETFKCWRRQGWRLLRQPTAKLGRPPIPPELHVLIRRMARENVTWGQKRIANELLLKLGLQVLPRTDRKYTPIDCVGGPGRHCQSQRWSTFIRNQAKGLVYTGVMLKASRTVQTMLDRIRRLRPSLRHWALQRESSPIKPPRPPVIIDPDEACGRLGAAALKRAEPIRGVERSPPEKQPSRHSQRVRAVEPVVAARVEMRSETWFRSRRNLTRLKVRDIRPAHDVLNRSKSWARAA